jgi:hypothetical protein
MKINNKEVDFGTLEIDGVDMRDYGDFCDAYFSYAEFTDGIQLTDAELETLTNECSDVLCDMAFESCISCAEAYYEGDR